MLCHTPVTHYVLLVTHYVSLYKEEYLSMTLEEKRDRDTVRELARQVVELASSDEYEARRKRWRDVNALRKPDRLLLGACAGLSSDPTAVQVALWLP